MSRNGGPGAWIFIPYIFSHIPVPKQILLTLESREIQLYPKHLNTEQRYRRKMVKKGRPVNPTHAARAALLPRANWDNREATPVRLQLMHGSGLTPNVVATDLESAVRGSGVPRDSGVQSLLLHTSLLQLANRVAIQGTRGNYPYPSPPGCRSSCGMSGKDAETLPHLWEWRGVGQSDTGHGDE